jgi:hypothetical protein
MVYKLERSLQPPKIEVNKFSAHFHHGHVIDTCAVTHALQQFGKLDQMRENESIQ